MNSLSEANTKFMFNLFQQFRKSKKNNIFYSPISITSALGMVLLGAEDNTAQQIKKVLHFDQVTENTTEKAATYHVDRSGNVHHQFQKLLTELNKSTDAYELKIANKLFGEKTYQFLQEYLDAIKKFYQTSVESVDFANAPEESRKKINSWVESQTNEKIKNLLPEGTIGSNTTLVLVNAIYFKGQWEKKFNKEDTKEEKFWPNKNTYKSIQMMRQYTSFHFASLEDVQARVLEIPYKGKDLSMIVLLPNEIDGLQKLEEKLTAEKLMEWTSLHNMRETPVHLHLPRFKVEESYDLKGTLSTMGMVDTFNGDADLSGMTGSRGLVLSGVLHKAFVEVTEEGAEAAAATAVVGIGSSSPSTNEEFHCNHPFLFFIRQNKTNSILFYGRFSSP
ncbi:serpin B3 [Gorilla gorilla gorilla]|uniref:serpin B3 n=1 Tax=Gorilla gorilla gorilla TaxID=9595 RepID=UPI0024460583|nr:serpin B3 [Gorilla gorilla gorilla]XP_055224726.1 serpin B3 [Gorilla gorilla gorilla]